MVNTVTNRVVRLLGKDETVRFMQLTLYQGAPAKKGLTTAVCNFYKSLGLPLTHSLVCCCVLEPAAGGESRPLPHALLHGLQTSAVLPVYPL